MPLQIHVLDDGRLVGESLVPTPDALGSTYKLFVLNQDRFEVVHRHNLTNSMDKAVVDVVGSPDGAIDLVESIPTARSPTIALETAVGKPWRGQMASGSWGGFATFDHSMVAIQHWYTVQSGIVTLRGNASVQQTHLGARCGDMKSDPYAPDTVQPTDLWVSPSGDLWVSGIACKSRDAVEIWKPGATTSTVQFVDIDPEEMFAGDDGASYIADLRGHARRWTGKAFEAVASAPAHAPIVTSDGRKWRIRNEKTGSALFQVKEGKEYAVEVPAQAQVMFDGKTLWAENDRLYRLDDGSGPKAISIADTDVARPSPYERVGFDPGGPRCKTNLVVLFGISKVTPPGYDFPLTRKALAGHTELKEVYFSIRVDHGQEYFTGLAPSYEVAEQLRALVEKSVAQSKPQVVCADPLVVRYFPIDVATGELLPSPDR